MRNLLIALVTTMILVPATARAQSLSDRVAEVRRRQQEETLQRRQQRLQASPRVRILQSLLYGRLSARFEDTPARDAFDFVRTALGINMVVRYSDDPVGHGIDPETPITLQADEMLALDVIELMLEQCALREPCTWQLRRSFLEIGTKERLAAESAREVRTYPVGELLFEVPYNDDAPLMGFGDAYAYGPYYQGAGPGMQYRNLNGPYRGSGGYGGIGYRNYGSGSGGGVTGGAIGLGQTSSGRSTSNVGGSRADRVDELLDLITGVIEPDAWHQNGGVWASIELIDDVLVVRAPDFIHRQIGGYPRVPPPPRASTGPKPPAAAGTPTTGPGSK